MIRDAARKLAKAKMKGSGIKIKPSHEGLLHRDLGIPAGQKIPESRIQKAKHSDNAAERKRATFAENAEGWEHGG